MEGRVGEDDGLNVYELSFDESLDYVEGSFRRLTHGPAWVTWKDGRRKELAEAPPDGEGVQVHFTDPTYVPDPLDQNAAGGGHNLEKVDVVFA